MLPKAFADGFPADDYTPHGYLDIPAHTRRLTPKGVVRSHDIGFRWHFPALGTGYGGRRETYRAGLRIGIDGALAVTDFDQVDSPYHSKNIVELRARHARGSISAEFHLVGADVIVARVSGRVDDRLVVRVDYSRHLGADQGWGESGLVGRCSGDLAVLKGFEDGEAFVLWTSEPTVAAAVTADSRIADEWVVQGVPDDQASAVVTGDSGQVVGLAAAGEWPGGREYDLTVMLARGRTEDEAVARLNQARENHWSVRAARRAEDDHFWATAPRLIGDWPAQWRHGLVYDLETLRMMVKPPVGVYTQPWDAMQIQAPRVVLGEAAIDALLLSYADPGTAQRLMLGTFADAIAPNIPCSREDGSVNMVSADGSSCGTGPQWGYPWMVLERLYDLEPDDAWLDRLYPHLAAYLDWWLAHRRDEDGWLVHACSWESGQDLSPRFGDQPLGGGHPTYHVRPVDLQASFSHAAATMARFAAILGRDRDVPGWRRLADEYAQRTEQLWNGSRYADADARVDALTDVDDVMLWAPAALGLAAPDRLAALGSAIQQADPQALVWPMFVWTAIDAALAAGQSEKAAEIASAVVDRAYGFWDARVAERGRTLPGVACEYWPVSGRCGGEGYGWGAFGVHLVLGVLAGLRVSGDRLTVRPLLPPGLREAGRCYGIRLTCHGVPVTVELRPLDDGVRVSVDGTHVDLAWGEPYAWEVSP